MTARRRYRFITGSRAKGPAGEAGGADSDGGKAAAFGPGRAARLGVLHEPHAQGAQRLPALEKGQAVALVVEWLAAVRTGGRKW